MRHITALVPLFVFAAIVPAVVLAQESQWTPADVAPASASLSASVSVPASVPSSVPVFPPATPQPREAGVVEEGSRLGESLTAAGSAAGSSPVLQAGLPSGLESSPPSRPPVDLQSNLLQSNLRSNAESSREALQEAGRKAWVWSLAPLAASQALDSASSYGMRELNPLLADPNGGFGMKAVVLKFAVVGALMGAEYLILRKSPRSARLFSLLNWSGAAVTTGLAVHNYAIR